jgi:hypothetical protein
LRQQQVFLNDHYPDYDHDPFFFSVCAYRYINLSQLLGLQPIR